MRIAFFANKFPVVSETFILRQIVGLIDLGHDVTIFAAWHPEQRDPVHSKFEKYNLLQRTVYLDDLIPRESGYWAAPVWPLSGRTWTPESNRPVRNFWRAMQAVPTFLASAAAFPQLALQLVSPAGYGEDALSLAALYRCAVLRRWKHHFDIAHAHFGPIGGSFRFVRELWNVPFVVSFHGYDFCTFPRLHGRDMYRELFQTADVITVGSNYAAEQVKRLGCAGAKLKKLSVGVPLNDVVFRERHLGSVKTIRVLSVGRLVKIKGHEYLLRAVAQIRPRYPQVRVDIVGDGPLRKRLEELIRELEIRDVATLHGAQANNIVLRMMDESHIFVLGSVDVHGDAEGQGLVVQEAQAMGLPVIVTNHGALPEGMLPNESGYVVAEGDANSLAEAVAKLIEQHEDWALMGRRGRDFVSERFSATVLDRQLVDLYTDAIRQFTDGRLRLSA